MEKKLNNDLLLDLLLLNLLLLLNSFASKFGGVGVFVFFVFLIVFLLLLILLMLLYLLYLNIFLIVWCFNEFFIFYVVFCVIIDLNLFVVDFFVVLRFCDGGGVCVFDCVGVGIVGLSVLYVVG